MAQYSIDDIMAWGPFREYPQERIEELKAGRERLSLREIAELDIPREDIWWAICYEATPAQRWHLITWCALHAHPDGPPEDLIAQCRAAEKDPRAAITWCETATCAPYRWDTWRDNMTAEEYEEEVASMTEAEKYEEEYEREEAEELKERMWTALITYALDLLEA